MAFVFQVKVHPRAALSELSNVAINAGVGGRIKLVTVDA
jgi:hypothetical protein